MSMTEWAEREVEIACKRENPNRKEGEWDYGCACYESALKAFKSLMEDGHSGFSISMTKQILMRLIDCKPLTPIEDTDDIWDDGRLDVRDGATTYQCKRMSSLFKDIYPDGTVKYTDVERYYAVEIDNPGHSYTSGLTRRIVDELCPITMPYNPPAKDIVLYTETILTDPKNGDFDTKGILYAILPDGERVDILRYFKEGETDWIEIDEAEYLERKERRIER